MKYIINSLIKYIIMKNLREMKKRFYHNKSKKVFLHNENLKKGKQKLNNYNYAK